MFLPLPTRLASREYILRDLCLKLEMEERYTQRYTQKWDSTLHVAYNRDLKMVKELVSFKAFGINTVLLTTVFVLVSLR